MLAHARWRMRAFLPLTAVVERAGAGCGRRPPAARCTRARKENARQPMCVCVCACVRACVRESVTVSVSVCARPCARACGARWPTCVVRNAAVHTSPCRGTSSSLCRPHTSHRTRTLHLDRQTLRFPSLPFPLLSSPSRTEPTKTAGPIFLRARDNKTAQRKATVELNGRTQRTEPAIRRHARGCCKGANVRARVHMQERQS